MYLYTQVQSNLKPYKLVLPSIDVGPLLPSDYNTWKADFSLLRNQKDTSNVKSTDQISA
jgi:hypothetical protein